MKLGNKKISTGPYGFFATPDGSVRLNPEGTRQLELWLKKYPVPGRLFTKMYRSLYNAAIHAGLTHEDIDSLCMVGACTAMCLYDPARGTLFETFAAAHFRSKVQTHLRDLVKASRHGHGTVSIQSHIDDEGTEFQITLGERDPDNHDDIKEQLASHLRLLPARDREVLLMRHGLNGRRMSLEEVGEVFDCCAENIRRIERNAIKTLRLGVA